MAMLTKMKPLFYCEIVIALSVEYTVASPHQLTDSEKGRAVYLIIFSCIFVLARCVGLYKFIYNT